MHLVFWEKWSTEKVMAGGRLKVIKSSPLLSKSMRWGFMGPSHVAPIGMLFLSLLSISLGLYHLCNQNHKYNSLAKRSLLSFHINNNHDLLPVVSYAVFRQPSVLSMRADVDILLHSLSSRHREQPNALKVSATLFSHLKVSKALSASSREVLYRIHTLCCIFSPSKFAPFVPAILEQSFRPPHLLHCIFRQRWKMADLTGNNKGPSPGRGLGLLKDEVGPWHKLHHRVVKLVFHFPLQNGKQIFVSKMNSHLLCWYRLLTENIQPFSKTDLQS